MEPKAKRQSAERVRREFTSRASALGFSRAKKSFWIRVQIHTIEFIHLHLFSFMPAFRVHFGIRVLNDTFDAPALNGPSSGDGWGDLAGHHHRDVLQRSRASAFPREMAVTRQRFASTLAKYWKVRSVSEQSAWSKNGGFYIRPSCRTIGCPSSATFEQDRTAGVTQ
jgi:hypothetical protein